MTQKKKLVIPPEIPEAKKKVRGSVNEAMRKRGGGGKISMIGGKVTLTITKFPSNEIVLKVPSDNPVFQYLPPGYDNAAGNLILQKEGWVCAAGLHTIPHPPVY